MPALLRLVVAVIAVLFTAGVPSYVAAGLRADCCAEPCEDALTEQHDAEQHDAEQHDAEQHNNDEAPTDGCPGEHGGRCPPLCDGCAAAPHAVAPARAVVEATSIRTSRPEFPALADPMSDPLPDGVFHPPRAAA